MTVYALLLLISQRRPPPVGGESLTHGYTTLTSSNGLLDICLVVACINPLGLKGRVGVVEQLRMHPGCTDETMNSVVGSIAINLLQIDGCHSIEEQRPPPALNRRWWLNCSVSGYSTHHQNENNPSTILTSRRAGISPITGQQMV